MIPMVNTVFGQQGIAGSTGFIWNGIGSFLNILSHPVAYSRPYIPWLFVIGQLTALFFGYFKILPKMSAFAVYFFTANILSKGGLFFTGGEVLICILLFYMIFINEDSEDNSMQNTINNTAFYAMLVQICILYFFSTFFKLYDTKWTSGNALLYVSEIPFYSSNWFSELTHYFPTVTKISTIAVLVYQGLFPFVVWIKRVKIPFLVFGVVLHLGIALGMGIFSFGMIMIITYLLFLDSSHIQKLTHLIPYKKRG